MNLTFVRMNTTDVLMQPEGWRVKTALKWWPRRALASLCWYILHKLRAVDQYACTVKTYHYGDVASGKVRELVFESISEVLNRDENPSDYCIVIGGKEFAEIMSDEVCYRSFITVPSGEFSYRRNGYRTRYLDIPVHVVAGLTGVAAIPKVIVEARK